MGRKTGEQLRYLYGPVPSRRLGLSLGVDIVPAKVCTLDCVYCQLGRTTQKSTELKDFVDINAILAELRERLAKGLRADFITIGGSGEPTLNSRLGELIEGIRKVTDIPVAILTNGTLLYRADVRAACTKADVVLPSLNAADEDLFEKINRPAAGITIEKLVWGLCEFRKEFRGQIWLEVFLVDAMNTSPEQIAGIHSIISRIGPDKVHLNTAVRPPAERNVRPVDVRTLRAIAKQMGERCEVIADFRASRCATRLEIKDEDVLSVLKRRPCSLEDICAGLGIGPNEALAHITHLQQHRLVISEQRGDVTFFRAVVGPR